MTEDQIKEVMKLVDAYGNAVEDAVYCRVCNEVDTYQAIESKLREFSIGNHWNQRTQQVLAAFDNPDSPEISGKLG